MSMIKVTHSSDISATVGVGGEIVKSSSDLQKQASTIFRCEYDALKPPKGKTGIHLVALGDSEAYPMNRNGDLFTKEACIKYHQTFVKHGHVFQHHRNKDPKKAIGTIKASAYNPEMHRIELYIWADNEKAKDHLERLEKTGEVPFSMACFRAGTPILTKDGFKPVEAIREGDEVLTHTGKWKPVIRTMSRKSPDYCELSFVSWGSRTLEVTGNHRVLAASFDDLERKFRKDRIAHPGHAWKRRHRAILHTTAKWKEVRDLSSYDYLCVPIVRPIGKSDDESVKWARLFGYYTAEGSMRGHGDKDLNVDITCNVNDCFVDEIETLAKWTSVSKNAHRLSDKCVVISCFGKEPCNRIFKSCGRKCENKRIPAEIRNGTYDEKFNFAAAWFNGDGWQDKNGLHWSIKSDTLSTDLQMLLASVNVPSSCDRIKHPEVRGFVRSKGAVEHVVSVSNEYSDLFVGISKAVHKSVCGGSKLRTFISGNYLMVPVKGVKKIEKATVVYNLSVKDDESYTAFGLAVHNCTVPNDRCFTKGTLVLTSKGFKPIESVKVGDIAITAEANEKIVTATMVNTSDKLTRVSVRGIPEEIECTPNHPFNVVSNDKMRSCHGSVCGKKRRHTPANGTSKCASCGRTIDLSSEWKRADKLEEGDYIKEKIDGSSESIVRGVSFAYLCGMYLGDGTPIWQVSGSGGSGDIERISGISISASGDDDDTGIIARINDAFLKCTGKKANAIKDSSGKNAFIVSLHDSLLAERIYSLVGAYSREKHIDSEILHWSKEEKNAFISGYLDADGSIGMRGGKHMIRICSSNKGLLFSLQRIMWSIGIPATLCHGNILENMKNDSGFVHKTSSYTLFFNRVCKELASKSDKLSRKYDDERAGRSNNVLLIDGYAYLPVRKSRTFVSDPVPVYNFEVEDEHTYVAEGVGVHNCSVCGNIRSKPGGDDECSHIRDNLGKIAEDGTQIGTYNDEPRWFDISFVGRPADRIAWNIKVASAMPEELTTMSSVKRAEVEGYTLPDDLAITSERSKRKLDILQKLASAYAQCASWLAGETKPANSRERFTFELRKLAGARLDDVTLARLRELNPGNAFAALGDAGIVLDAPSFFKYAFGPDYGQVEKYLPFVAKAASAVVREAVETATCAALCNDGRYDACPLGRFGRPDLTLRSQLAKSAAAYGIGTADAVTGILETIACGAEPSFAPNGTEKTAEACGVDPDVATKLARKYVMYKLAGLCAVLDGPCGLSLREDDVIFVSAAQDLKEL